MADSSITGLLNDWRSGSSEAESKLMSAVLPELKRLARGYMRRERDDHTLQPTALVNEAYLELVAQHDQSWQGRAHFYAVAAQSMRRILVDHARARAAKKRGGNELRVPFEENLAVATPDVDVLALDAALGRLNDMDPRQSQIVVLRFFGGLTNDEIAYVMNISTRTVRREWAMAKAWLFGELGPSKT